MQMRICCRVLFFSQCVFFPLSERREKDTVRKFESGDVEPPSRACTGRSDGDLKIVGVSKATRGFGFGDGSVCSHTHHLAARSGGQSRRLRA